MYKVKNSRFLVDDEGPFQSVLFSPFFSTPAFSRSPRKRRTHGKQVKYFPVTRVFDQGATQEEVFEGAVLPLVDGVCDSAQDALVFMYGMSGGGKTHTNVGTGTDPGLVPRALT